MRFTTNCLSELYKTTKAAFQQRNTA